MIHNLDKALHAGAGFLIVYFTGWIWLAIAAGLGKELYDYLNPKKHTTDVNDFLFTVVGGLIALHI